MPTVKKDTLSRGFGMKFDLAAEAQTGTAGHAYRLHKGVTVTELFSLTFQGIENCIDE